MSGRNYDTLLDDKLSFRLVTIFFLIIIILNLRWDVQPHFLLNFYIFIWKNNFFIILLLAQIDMQFLLLSDLRV